MTKKKMFTSKPTPSTEQPVLNVNNFPFTGDDDGEVYDTSPFLQQVLPSWGWDIIERYDLQASASPVEAVTELLLLAAHLLERTSLLTSQSCAVTASTAYRLGLHETMIADARLLLPFCPPLSEEVRLDIVDNRMVWFHERTRQQIARLG